MILTGANYNVFYNEEMKLLHRNELKKEPAERDKEILGGYVGFPLEKKKKKAKAVAICHTLFVYAYL